MAKEIKQVTFTFGPCTRSAKEHDCIGYLELPTDDPTAMDGKVHLFCCCPCHA